MGTKVLRDYLADVNYLQAALWPGEQAPVRTRYWKRSFTSVLITEIASQTLAS